MTVTTKPLWIQAGGETAVQARRLIKAIFGTPGIIASTDMAVTAKGTPDMSVNVALGQCVVAGSEATDQGYYVVYNDATINLAISAADSTNGRIDAVYVKVQDSEQSGATDAASIVVVTGTAAATPVAPNAPTVSHYLLATIAVAANATSITSATITDKRTSAVPQRDSIAVALAASAASKTFTVTFTTPFAAAPAVTDLVTEPGGGGYGVVWTSITATGLAGTAFATSGTGSASAKTVTVYWRAEPA